ncbi:MAG: hypothetical protein MHMPM18_003154 [Marteilia pararefringens]
MVKQASKAGAGRQVPKPGMKSGGEANLADRSLEANGLFSSTKFRFIDEPYVAPKINHKNGAGDQATVRRQFVTAGATKSKSANQDGYFSETFERILESEALKDSNKEVKSKNNHSPSPPFYPPGIRSVNHLGSVPNTKTTKKVDVMPTISRSKAKPKESVNEVSSKTKGKQFVCNPPRKGTGYGYIDVTIGKYPPHHTLSPNKSDNVQGRPYSEAKKSSDKEKLVPFRTGGRALEESTKLESTKEDRFTRKLSKKSIAETKGKEAPERYDKPVFKPAGASKPIGQAKIGTFSNYLDRTNTNENNRSSPASGARDKKKQQKANNSDASSRFVTAKYFIPTHAKKSYYTRSILQYNVARQQSIITPSAGV